MAKRILVFLLILSILGILTASVFYPRLYLPGYYPIVFNRYDIYKTNKGLNFVKNEPYRVSTMYPTRTERIDLENDQVAVRTTVEDEDILPELIIPYDQYLQNMMKMVYRKGLFSEFKNKRQNTQSTQSGLIGEFVIDLPTVAMPKAVQKVLGSRAGRLNLDGSEKITIGGSSTKRKRVPIYDTSNSSRFDLKMEQETNLRLSGTIGEKIAVNLKYNSQMDEQLFDPNNINVKYTGDEDEIVKSIEAGNITLSLAGSRYISYSTSSQGLFGVTSRFKYGNLDLSVIASKEEGQKNTLSYIGQSQADSTVFRSKDYTARTMYYIADPYELYDLYEADDMGPNVPTGYLNNAIKTNSRGAWLIKNPGLLPQNGTVNVYIDDFNSTNNVASAVGDTIFFSQNDFYVPYYDKLVEGTDFVTDYNSGVIQILRAVDRRTTIAIQYIRQDGIPVPLNMDPDDPEDTVTHAKPIRRRNQEYDSTDPNNVWHYQMRNVYNMNKTNIKSDGFNLEIFTENVDKTRNYNVADSLQVGSIVTYNDYLRMDSSGDGLINGDDNTVNLTSGIVYFPFIQPFAPLGDGIIYEDENENIYNDDIDFFISVKGKIGREAIELPQGGILKGSVRVLVNSKQQKENIDYLVDYDFGRITFLTAEGKDPDAKIEIDYEYRSTFAVAQKTLTGVRADWNITNYAKLGGTLIYRSESVSDKRPKIGNENIQMWMADVDGTLTLKPKFITKILNALPLINTTAESRLTLSGEIAYTIPNIYGDPNGKKKEAYIDDMESIVDSYPMGVTIGTWSLASKPWNQSLAKGRTIWYNPKNIHRDQLEDPLTLTETEKTENVTVLALKVFPNNLGMPGAGIWSWGGIMKYLGNQLDFSQKKYIEVLVKLDVRNNEPTPNATLHIDLGDLNEDFYTEYGGLNVLNNEDKNNDGVPTHDEDIGLDGISQDDPGHDPNDIASNVIDQATGDYPFLNCTEANGVLDTEDLDGNGVLNQLDRYLSYSVSLIDSLHLENINHDGWRLYRIPLTDPEYYQIVNNSTTGVQPSLKKISYARIWLETDTTAKVLIADASVVGNKWQDFYVRDENGSIVSGSELTQYGTQYLSGIVNNQKNRSHYTPPKGTVFIEDRRETSESALSLNIANLQPGQQVLLRQRLFDPYSLLSYDRLKFWVYPENIDLNSAYPDSIDIIFRVGADSLNYYQITQRVGVKAWQAKMSESLWDQFVYNLQELSSLKEVFPVETQGTIDHGSYSVSFIGRKTTLTNISEVYFGVAIPDSLPVNREFSGTVFFNDLRVADPYEDIGIAKRLTLNAALADFITLDVDYDDKSENFNATIQRGRTNTFTSTKSLTITNKYFLNKLLPTSWNMDIPLSLNRTYTEGIPRYRANSDLLRENIVDLTEKEREKNETLIYSADVALSMKSAPKNKILNYTLYRTSFSARLEDSYLHNPTQQDTTLTYRGTLNYNLSLPADKVSFPLIKRYRLGWFPTTWNNSFTFNATEPNAYYWDTRENITGWYPRANTADTRLLTTDTNINWNLLSDVTARLRLNTKRDLIQKNYYKEINLGKETEYSQDVELAYNPNYLSNIFNINSSVTTKYTEFQRKHTENTDEGPIDVYSSDGGNNRSIRATVTLQNSNLLSGWSQSLKAKAPQKKRDDKKDKEQPKEEIKDPNQTGVEYKFDGNQEEPKEELDKEGDKKELTEEEKKKLEMQDSDKGEDKPGEEVKKEEEGSQKNNLEPKEETDPREEPKVPKDGDQGGKKPSNSFSFIQVPATLLNYLSKFKNINASFQNTYNMTYTEKDVRPPFAFQIGLPHSVAPDFLDATTNDNTLTLSSGLAVSRNVDSTINYSYTMNRRQSNASNQSISTTFPDITVSLVDFERYIGVSKWLSGSRLNTGFQYTVRQNGDLDWLEPSQETFTTALSPLLGFSGNFAKSLSVNLSYSLSRTKNITAMDNYDIIKTNNSQSMNGTVSYSFRAGKGFKIPFSGKKIHIKNELSSSLTLLFEKNFDETIGREATQVDRNTSRIAITPGATYQFDQNIKGGITSAWELTSDKRLDDGTRIFRLGVWVEVNL
ncbi:MAG TPA: hypothetical protein PL124_00295 [Candidatus Cloacimonadota bacterium]|nr:hypothetical protein [Candidatus Cloacimonadota bacterium]HPS37830.1 hypothetical protein [Candidatus Cloacimonadota bacterium]